MNPEELEVDALELVASAKGGCHDAFSQLVHHYEKRIYNFINQMVRSAHDAEDLTQDTFVKAFRNLHRLDSPKGFAPWLFTIAKRTALNHFRSMRHSEEIPEEAEHPGANPAQMLECKDEGTSIWGLARRLKPAQFQVLWLRYGEGFSVEETSRIMDTNQIRVKVLLHRGRLQLARLLTHRNSSRPLPEKGFAFPVSEKNQSLLVL